MSLQCRRHNSFTGHDTYLPTLHDTYGNVPRYVHAATTYSAETVLRRYCAYHRTTYARMRAYVHACCVRGNKYVPACSSIHLQSES
eukprot:1327167-Amorphochlora_amoeboformis.AAC.2